MNSFTPAQLRVIRELAGVYWEAECRVPYWPEEHLQKHKDQYIKDILAGLTDPDYWGNNAEV